MLTKIFLFFIPILLVLFLINCDDFQEEDFGVEGLDKKACTTFNDTTLVPIAVSAKDISKIDASWIGSNVYSNVNAIIDSLDSDSAIVQSGDEAFQIDIPADTSYIALSTAEDKLVFYVTNAVEIKPIRSTGAIVEPSDLSIKLELIYEGEEIRYRAEFKELESMMLLQIVKGEQYDTKVPTRMLILGR